MKNGENLIVVTLLDYVVLSTPRILLRGYVDLFTTIVPPPPCL